MNRNKPLTLHHILSAHNRMQRLGAGVVFVVALTMYWLTADRFASYWDCPEYITCASRLEIGHPPGNPVWMLAMRILLIPFPDTLHPLVVNLSSGLFTALAAYLLTRLCYVALGFSMGKTGMRILLPAMGGGLIFSLCDSVWFSAVEAEVYAMSTFLSLLSLWLTVKWCVAESARRRDRLIILTAYLMGLSLGVHQLNLLVIPVIALAVCYRTSPGKVSFLRGAGAFSIGCLIVVGVLFGIMNGTLQIAGNCELLAVNRLSLPPFAGVIAYGILFIVLFSTLTPRLSGMPSRYAPLAVFPLILISGVFFFGDHGWLAMMLSFLVAVAIFHITGLSRRTVVTALWCLGFIVLGYSSFALILIRGYASPPMNEGTPTDIFALASYISRDQYGSTPLIYGPTPFSRSLLKEEWIAGDTVPVYRRYALKTVKPKYRLYIDNPRLSQGYGLLTTSDSMANRRILDQTKRGYLLADYAFRTITTPELDMWFPRITGNSPSHIDSYRDWAGMEKETMEKRAVSTVVDTLGNPAGRMLPSGIRKKEISYRPTYLQNLQFFLSYQLGYMYLRYLGWNFIGRQNDYPSTGEIEHGNVATGISIIDNLMLGDSDLLPVSLTHENKGRNIFFGIPFIIGIIGILFLEKKGKNGRRTLTLTVLLFLMTGIAIVVYLNQTPGEPRERDYSFLISYAAFCIWISAGIYACSSILLRIIRKLRKGMTMKPRKAAFVCALIPFGLATWYGFVNFNDHDRRNRGEPLNLAADILESIPPSVIFSQGDNYTFPLWFAQETMGIGKEHCVVDLSYLTLPTYVAHLLRQGTLPLTAKESDIIYGAFANTLLPENADTIPVPLIEALRELYADSSANPAFRHSRVTIPGASGGDSIILNLKDFTNGSNRISFRALMILDILASSREMENPKQIRFLNRLTSESYKPLMSVLKPDVYTLVYGAEEKDSRLDSLHTISSSNPAYPDPLISEMVRQRRGEIIAAAKRVAADNPAEALAMLNKAAESFPYRVHPAGAASIGDSYMYEGLDFCTLLLDISLQTGDTLPATEARRLCRMMIEESEALNRFTLSLPHYRRATVSASSRRLASIIPRLRNQALRADSIINILSKK